MKNRAQVKKTIATQNKGNGNANAALGVPTQQSNTGMCGVSADAAWNVLGEC